MLGVLFLALLAVVSWPARAAGLVFARDFRARLAGMRRWRMIEWFGLVLVIAATATLGALGSAYPVFENDALQYVHVASTIVERANIDFYPAVPADPATGFYAVSSHPLGFVSLHVWNFLVIGETGPGTAAKLPSLLYVFFTLCALAALTWGKPPLCLLLAATLLLATPAYFWGAASHAIDSFRGYLLLNALIWTLECARRQCALRTAVSAGLFCGLSMYSHSIQMLITLPLAALARAAISRERLSKRLAGLAVIALVAGALGGQQALTNLAKFGSPFFDTLAVLQLPSMHYDDYVWFQKGVFHEAHAMYAGLRMVFTETDLIGYGYWLLAALVPFASLAKFRALMMSDVSRLLLSTLVGFHLAVMAAILIGATGVINGVRYVLSVQPFVAALAGLCFGEIHAMVVRAR